MGEEEERARRLQAFQGYAVTGTLLSSAADRAIGAPLPPGHRGEEITDGVLEGPASAVWTRPRTGSMPRRRSSSGCWAGQGCLPFKKGTPGTLHGKAGPRLYQVEEHLEGTFTYPAIGPVHPLLGFQEAGVVWSSRRQSSPERYLDHYREFLQVSGAVGPFLQQGSRFGRELDVACQAKDDLPEAMACNQGGAGESMITTSASPARLPRIVTGDERDLVIPRNLMNSSKWRTSRVFGVHLKG